jgi:hypothetical protein
MRLGVGAALVDGTLVPGDVEVADGKIAAVGLGSPNGNGIASPGFVDLQVNGLRASTSSPPTRRLPARGQGAARVRRDVVPADVHHVAEDELVGALAEVPVNGDAPQCAGCAPGGAVHLARAARARIRRMRAATRTARCWSGCWRPGRSAT